MKAKKVDLSLDQYFTCSMEFIRVTFAALHFDINKWWHFLCVTNPHTKLKYKIKVQNY